MMTSTRATEVLVIDDDRGIREALKMILTEEGYAVTTASNANQGAAAALSEPLPDVVIADNTMLDTQTGIVDMAEVMSAAKHPGSLLGLTAMVNSVTAEQRARISELLGPERFILMGKPFDIDTLINTVGQLAVASGASVTQNDSHPNALL